MAMPNNFEYYLEIGISKKISADKPRAEFLIKEAEKNFKGLNKRILAMKGIDEDNVNSIIKDIYDMNRNLRCLSTLKFGVSTDDF